MKIGRIPVAIGLITFGFALALDNLAVTTRATDAVVRFWPLLMIGAGLEYLWATRDEKRRNAGFDVGGMILLIVIVAVTTGLRWVPFQIGFFPQITKTVYATSSATGVKELRVTTSVGRIELDAGSDSIEVEATVTGREGDDLDDVAVIISSGAVATISIDPGKANRALPTSYRIRAPQGLKVVMDSGTGSVKVRGYEGDLTLGTRTGRTEVETGSGSLKVNGSTGSITVTDFNGDVTLQTSTGSISTEGTTGALHITGNTSSVTAKAFRGGPVNIRTTTGSIRAETFMALEGDVKLRASTGSVTLEVPANSSMHVGARTSTGGISGPGFLTITKSGAGRTASGTLGDGKYKVDLEASTGSVTLRH